MITPKTLIAITTYKKNKALIEILASLLKNGYFTLNHEILIADDNNGEAREVFESFDVDPKFKSYISGKNAGVAKNKNRCIYYFLNKTDAEGIIMLDDDIEFIREGLIPEFWLASEKNNQAHINTFLGSYIHDPNSNQGFFGTFPVVAESDELYWTQGCQGIGSFYTRELMQAIGYFEKFPYRYGFEHAEHSARALRIQGYCPELFPMLKRSPKYFKTQHVANNYEVDLEQVHGRQNQKYREYLTRTYSGVNLRCNDHGLRLSEELILS